MKHLISTIFISALFAIAPTNAANPTNTNQLILEAQELNSQAAELGFEWTTTVKLINDANQALQAGHIDKASELATRAIEQAKSAIKQAKYAEQNWQDSAL